MATSLRDLGPVAAAEQMRNAVVGVCMMQWLIADVLLFRTSRRGRYVLLHGAFLAYGSICFDISTGLERICTCVRLFACCPGTRGWKASVQTLLLVS
jgi:hypothetical protein